METRTNQATEPRREHRRFSKSRIRPEHANDPMPGPKRPNAASLLSTCNDTISTSANPADVSEAIGKIFQSKTEARQRRKIEGQQTKSYQDDSQRPLVCLAFVLPILVFYEIGAILLGTQSLRSGVDQWMHQLLQQFGFGQLVILPLVTVGVMLAWHHRVHDHWRIRPGTLFGMLIEAAGLGLILFCAASSLNMLLGGSQPVQTALDLSRAWWAGIVSYVGSGIYEEFLFRVVLLSSAVYLITKHCQKRKLALSMAVVLVSLFFAGLHYNVFNPAGSQFELSSFAFRFGASIVFCVLYLFRGFGIAVGTHVAYDVLTQI